MNRIMTTLLEVVCKCRFSYTQLLTLRHVKVSPLSSLKKRKNTEQIVYAWRKKHCRKIKICKNLFHKTINALCFFLISFLNSVFLRSAEALFQLH